MYVYKLTRYYYCKARLYFKHAFVIAPWFCNEASAYSTCLWYLDLSTELNILVYKLRHNPCHQYEAYIAAGNWSKMNEYNSATQWFKKAIELDPSRSYAYMLIGYENIDRGDCLNAKSYFAKCMVTNKRCYRGWFGMASCYKNLHLYQQAKTLLWEAFRLHPRHPVVLSTLAEVLYKLQEYDKAEIIVRKLIKIKINNTEEDEVLLEKIMERSRDMLGNEDSSFIY